MGTTCRIAGGSLSYNFVFAVLFVIAFQFALVFVFAIVNKFAIEFVFEIVFVFSFVFVFAVGGTTTRTSCRFAGGSLSYNFPQGLCSALLPLLLSALLILLARIALLLGIKNFGEPHRIHSLHYTT